MIWLLAIIAYFLFVFLIIRFFQSVSKWDGEIKSFSDKNRDTWIEEGEKPFVKR